MISLDRIRRAWNYGFDRLSAEDAKQIIADCRNPAGFHPLLALTVDDALGDMLNTFVDHPALRRLIQRACKEIERKSETAWNDVVTAKLWAAKLAETYAKEEGIVLTRWANVLPRQLFLREEKPHPQQSERPIAEPRSPHERPTMRDYLTKLNNSEIEEEIRTSARKRHTQQPIEHIEEPAQYPCLAELASQAE